MIRRATAAVVRQGLAAVAGVLFAAVLWIALLTLAGMALIVGGVYLTFGLPAAMLCAGVMCSGLAFVLIMGLRNG